MKPLLFTILVLGLIAWIIADQLRNAPECRPSDQPEPVEPKFKPSHETSRQMFAKIVRRMKGE